MKTPFLNWIIKYRKFWTSMNMNIEQVPKILPLWQLFLWSMFKENHEEYVDWFLKAHGTCQIMSLQEMGNGQLWILMLNLLLFWLLGDQINIKSYLCLVYIKVCFEIFLFKKIPKKSGRHPPPCQTLVNRF